MTTGIKYLSSANIISSAAASLGLTNPPNQMTWRQWAYDAQRHIGFTELYQMEKEVLIEDLRFPIPDNMADPISIRILADPAVSELLGTLPTCIYPTLQVSRFKCVSCQNYINGTQYYSQWQVTMTESNGYYVLSSNAVGYNKAQILYYAFPVIDGDLVFPEYNARAITAYIEYMHLKQQSNLRDDNMMLAKVNQAYQQWIILKNDAIGHELTPTLLELKDLAQTFAGALPIDVRMMNQGSWRNPLWGSLWF